MKYEIILEAFYKRLKIQRYSENTIKSYIDYASLFLKAMDHHSSLRDVRMEEIECFINNKVHRGQISVSYQKGLVSTIKKLYKLLLDMDLHLDYLYPKRTVKQIPKFFTKEEVTRLFNVIDNLKHKAILMTIYSCGLRLSELLNLELSDIKSSALIILIRQSKGNKDRVVSLSPKLLEVLRLYYTSYKPKKYVFEGEKGGRYSERSVQLILKKYLAKAKILTLGSVHTLRHSYATHLIQSGIDIRVVQELLGHENIKTTMLYTHITDITKKHTPSPLDFL